MLISEVEKGNSEKILLQFSRMNKEEIETLFYIVNKLFCRMNRINDSWFLQLNIHQLRCFLIECHKKKFSKNEMDTLYSILNNKKVIWSGRSFNFDLTYKPIICSIINCTPDSFFDSGVRDTTYKIIDKIENDLYEGASIIEIGGKSTRPNHLEISDYEEWTRVEPVIKAVKENFPSTVLSIDTNSSFVMENALNKYGVDIINDINGFESIKKLKIISEYQPSVIVMNNGRDGGKNIVDLYNYFDSKLDQLSSLGLKKSQIALDPGIGFSLHSNPTDNMIRIKIISQLNHPTMIAISRKSFMGKLFDLDVNDRLVSSIILEGIMIRSGGRILRVHDVKATKKLIEIVNLYEKTTLGDSIIAFKK